jgi:hypothetical protein
VVISFSDIDILVIVTKGVPPPCLVVVVVCVTAGLVEIFPLEFDEDSDCGFVVITPGEEVEVVVVMTTGFEVVVLLIEIALPPVVKRSCSMLNSL